MYSSPEAVRQYSRVRPADLGFDSEQALDAWLAEMLSEIADYINRYTGDDFTDDTPAGIDGIAREMGRNVVAQSIQSRETPVIRVDDWKVKLVEPEILTASIRRALRLYRKKSMPRFFVVNSEAG